MNKTAGLRLSDKEYEILEQLKKAYNISNTSELIRVLIRKDYTNLLSYEGLEKLSEKQIYQLDLHNNCITMKKGKENAMYKSIM